MKQTGIIVSGYFNPIHKGHIELFQNAKKLGDILIVIVNNDIQRKLKGSKEFMLQDERKIIINELKVTDSVYISVDLDKTVCETLKKIHSKYSTNYNLVFANGGDQNNEDIPEANICEKLEIKMIDNLGNKIQSSSWLLKK
jgi:cytidyltransferase-like protein